MFPEFNQICEEMSAGGPLIAIEVNAPRSTDCVAQLRQLCGLHNPNEARAQNPGSIRAEFGVDIVKNAVHCTDLDEDALTECEYFFTILN